MEDFFYYYYFSFISFNLSFLLHLFYYMRLVRHFWCSRGTTYRGATCIARHHFSSFPFPAFGYHFIALHCSSSFVFWVFSFLNTFRLLTISQSTSQSVIQSANIKKRCKNKNENKKKHNNPSSIFISYEIFFSGLERFRCEKLFLFTLLMST